MGRSELVYKASVTGCYHSENQDAYAVLPLAGGGFAAAVADGVGSCSHAAAGAAIAARTAVEEAAAGYEPGMDGTALRTLLHEAFHSAWSAVCRQAEADDLPDTEYDTTLTLCVFDKGQLAWGQAGDSGVIIRDEDDARRVVTQQQQEGRYVLPLASGPGVWAFGECRARACLLCSDGLLDMLVTPLMGLNHDLAALFLDRPETTPDQLPALEGALSRWLEGIPKEWSDDKTVVTIFTPGEQGGSSDANDDHTQDRPDEGRREAHLG